MKAICPLVLWHVIAFLYFSLLPITLCVDNASGRTTHSRSDIIVANNGAVASDDLRCSKIGTNVLREGGHAVDAAVAAALCLGVVSPASSGIGGGALMVLRLANGKAQAYDMRETAPMKASENMYNGNATLKAGGPLSIAIPGELAGLYKVWKEHGRLPWKRLVMPSAVLARAFKIAPFLQYQMRVVESDILDDKGLRDVFTVNGKLLQVGDICHNKKLAETLTIIAKEGVDSFYNGSIAEKIIEDIQKLGGILTKEDMQTYQVRIRNPIVTDILGMKLIGMPPPSSGGAGVPLMLNILSQYNLPSGVSGALGTHRVVEALKHVFAVRTNLGDSDFVNVTSVISDMISLEFAKKLQKTINDNMTFGPSYYGGKWNPIQDHGTAHLSIVDKERNAVAITCTINYHFGSRILSPSTGIVLNNEMDDFSMPGNFTDPPPAPANFIRPGKRPLSSMSPTIILKNEKLIGVIGASGGPTILISVGQVILNHFFKKMDQLSSVMAPRVYHRWLPNVVFFENFTSVTGDHYEVPAYIRTSLRKKGHVLKSVDIGAIINFITLNSGGNEIGMIIAVGDSRRGAVPAGY